jgi:hypothetical protein
MMLLNSATQLLLGGVDGVGLPLSEAVSFPLPSQSLSRGGGHLSGEQRRQRLRELEVVEYGLSLQQNCGERLQDVPFAPFPLLIPFGWRPEPVIQLEKKDAAPRKPPRANAHTTCKVFIGGLSSATNEKDLLKHFGTFGNVMSADILVDAETGKSRGFGFIVFDGAVPDGVLGVDHCFHGRNCGTRIYGEAPDVYAGNYFTNTNFRQDRYPKGKGKGDADWDAGKGKMLRHRRRPNQPSPMQSRDDAFAQLAADAAPVPASE